MDNMPTSLLDPDPYLRTHATVNRQKQQIPSVLSINKVQRPTVGTVLAWYIRRAWRQSYCCTNKRHKRKAEEGIYLLHRIVYRRPETAVEDPYPPRKSIVLSIYLHTYVRGSPREEASII